MQAIVGVLLVFSLVVFLISMRDVKGIMNKTSVEAMGMAIRHVAGNMQPLLEANRSAVAVAGAVRDPARKKSSPASITQVLTSFILFSFSSPLLLPKYLSLASSLAYVTRGR